MERGLFDPAIGADEFGSVLVGQRDQFGFLDANAVGVGMDLAEAIVRVVASALYRNTVDGEQELLSASTRSDVELPPGRIDG